MLSKIEFAGQVRFQSFLQGHSGNPGDPQAVIRKQVLITVQAWCPYGYLRLPAPSRGPVSAVTY